MKTFNGNIWTETDDRGVVKIGFSRAYIEQQLGECFHVMQADRRVARQGQPIMVLETNDGTSRIKSPLNGRIIKFNNKAMDFPDRLSEDDVILEVLPDGVKLPETKAKPKVEYKTWVNNDMFVQVNNPFQVPPPVIADDRVHDDERREALRREVFEQQRRMVEERARRAADAIQARARRRVR